MPPEQSVCSDDAENVVESLDLPEKDENPLALFPTKPEEQVIEETLTESKEAMDDPYVFPRQIRRVAVIGAGPSGVSSS